MEQIQISADPGGGAYGQIKASGAYIRRVIHDQLETDNSKKARLSITNWGLLFLILISLVLYTAETEKEIKESQWALFNFINIVILCIFCAEFVLRLCVAGVNEQYRGWGGLARYAKSNPIILLVDFLAFAPELFLTVLGIASPSWMRALRVCRLFKMARYVPAFRLVISALRSCYQELFVSLALSSVLWYVASVMLYLAERDIQPDKFGSITRSMWWSVVTLTTVGYGDVYPISWVGKVVAGGIAIVGIGTLALPSGIIAGAFLTKYRERMSEERG